MIKKANYTLLLCALLLLLGSYLAAGFADNLLRYYALTALLCSLGAIYVPSLLAIPKDRPLDFGQRPILLREGFFSLCLGCGCFFLSTGINSLMALLGEAVGIPLYGSEIPVRGYQLFASLVVVALIPAVAEEKLFRGLLLNAYRPLGKKRALFFTALFFALMHGELMALPSIFLTAWIFGELAWDSRSSYPSVIAHFANNAMVILVSASLGEMTEAEQALSATYGFMDYLPGILMYLLMGLPLVHMARRSLKLSFALRTEKAEATPEAPKALSFGERFSFLLPLALLLGINLLGVIRNAA